MKAHYGKEVILLVDEYDVPLAKASDNGYYEDMLEVMRSFLGMVWKSNPNLKFAVVTGCLRIAKESIFTGANNFISNSILGQSYQDYFGFSEEEVSELLKAAGLQDALPEMKKWFEEEITAKDRTSLFRAWWNGDADTLTQEITALLFETISYFDYKEDFYHAIVAGIFLGTGYAVKTNAEQGLGQDLPD